ncbi:hypothetical protein niasHT_007978 [Heterodera trifolii]|uniref:Potassium channel domain-containing protein n=1 Tax=Heterodera trifolii TaxID=157864 RepID=A0ABD2LZW0_9BILA
MKVFSFLFSHFRLFYKKRLRYALPFLILVLYTAFGAYIFRYFELEADEQRRAHYRANAEYAFKRTLSRMLEVRCEEGLDEAGQSLQARHVKEHLFWLVDYLNLTRVIEERSESSPWTWVGAMFYAGQLYTTIGYGIPITQTSGGRLASIAYIMVGIPLFLIILTEIGRLLSRGLRKLYKKLHAARKKLPEASRKMSEPMRAIYHLTAAMAGTAVGSAATPMINGAVRGELLVEEEMRRREEERRDAQKALEKLKKEAQKAAERGGGEPPQQFPIPWALVILLMWTMLSAALFCIWETEWGYMTSIYFFFVSISTVGLGDLVPTNPDMMIVNFFMILIGLALLSMCIDLIQKALQKLIERLIEQYIDEIEKMAAEVTNLEDEEEAPEDIPPLFPETAAVLTEGGSRRGSNARRKSSTIGRMKDWIAERASIILVNKIYPEESSDDESETDSEEGAEDEQLQRVEEVEVEDEPIQLEAVVVERRPLLREAAIRGGGGLANGTDAGGKAAAEMIIPDRRVSFGSIMSSQQGSIGKRKAKKAPKLPKNYADALLRYDPSKIQAIQAREMAKLRREGRSADFRSRLFAKFTANKRFTQIVESNQPKQMVSSSIQTSPVQSPIPSRRTWRLRRIGCGVESMDSTSTSEINGLTTSRTDNNSCSANDLDSLYSNTYFDLRFGGFSTDSVPHLMAQQNTPQVLTYPVGKQSYEARRKFSAKLLGLFGRILPRGDENGGRETEEEEKKLLARRDSEATSSEADGAGTAAREALGEVRIHPLPRKSRPRSKCHSTPSSPPMKRDYQRLNAVFNGRQNDGNENDPSLPTTPLILITDPAATELRHLSMTPHSSPVYGSNPNLQQSDHTHNAKRKRTASANRTSPPSVSPPLGTVPLHHRHLARRRRFSAIPLFKRTESLSALNERWREMRRTNMASIGRRMRSMESNEEEEGARQ